MPTDAVRALRNTLGCFTTGVCIVTAREPDGAVIGLTINSFASVSLDPPLILWSLDRGSDRYEVFAKAERFGINVLQAEQQALSQTLSRKGAGRIEDDVLRDDRNGTPLIAGALAAMSCEIERRHDGGDHIILVARVLAHHHADRGEPLLYYRGRYRGLDQRAE